MLDELDVFESELLELLVLELLELESLGELWGWDWVVLGVVVSLRLDAVGVTGVLILDLFIFMSW